MAGKKKDKVLDVTAPSPLSPRAIEGSEGYTAPLKPKKKKNQDLRNIKYIYYATQPGLRSWDVQVLQNKYSPNQKSIEFASNWSNMPTYYKNQWLYENKKLVQDKTLEDQYGWALSTPDVRKLALEQSVPQLEQGEKLKWTKAYSNFPDIGRAVALGVASGQINSQQASNVSDAVEILESTIKVLSYNSEEMRKKEFAKFTPQKQYAMLLISDALIQEFLNSAPENVETVAEQSNAVYDWIGDKLSWAWDGLLWLNEFGQHVGRTIVAAGALDFSLNMEDRANLPNLLEAWRETEEGAIDKEKYRQLKQEYGDLKVKVLKDVAQAMHSEDEDAFGYLLYKYAYNEEALQIIDQILFEEDRTPEIDELLGRVDAIRKDDLGNMVGNALLPDDWEGASPLYTFIDKTTNLAGVFLLDPTLAAGKAVKAAKIFRYGILKNSADGRLHLALARPNVQAELSRIADSINEFNSVNVKVRGEVRAQMRIKHGKYLTDEAIDSLAEYAKTLRPVSLGEVGFPTAARNIEADDVANWIQGLNDVERIAAGKAPVIQLLGQAQPARRGEVYLPHTSRWRNARIKARLATRKVLSTKKDFEEIADLMFSPGIISGETEAMAKMIYPEGIPLDNALAAQQLSTFLANPENTALLARTFNFDPSTIKLSWFKSGLPGSAKYTARGFKPKALRSKVDRFLKNFERAPRAGAISFADASDVDIIRQWARIGMPAYFADMVAEVWRVANVGQRQTILAGISDMLVKGKGIYNTTPEQIAAVQEMVTSSLRASEQYAVTQQKILVFGDEIDVLAETSARYSRAVINDLDDVKKAEITRINIQLAKAIERRRVAQLELQNIRFQINDLERSVKSGIALSNELSALKTTSAESIAGLEVQVSQLGDEITDLVKQVDKSLKPTVRESRTLARDTKKTLSKHERNLNRRIKSLEYTLYRADVTGMKPDQIANAQNMLTRLKAELGVYQQAKTGDFFFTQKALYARQEVADGNYLSLYNPSEYNGKQHALSLWQTSDTGTLPNLDVLQYVSAKAGITQKLLGWTYSGWVSKMTDFWSIGNLYGPRYIQRAAIEDWIGYAASAGSASEAAKGIVVSRTLREARGKKLGFLSEFSRKRIAPKVENSKILSQIFLPYLDGDEIIAARKAYLEGNMQGFNELVTKGMMRRSVSTFLTRIDDIDRSAIDWLSKQTDYMRINDRIAEIGMDLNRGSLTDNLAAADPTVTRFLKFNVGSLRNDLIAKGYPREALKGDFTNIAIHDMNPRSFALWQRNLIGTLHEDGAIGQALFLSLRKKTLLSEAREEAITRIAAIIDDPVKGKVYRDRLRIFNEPGMTSRMFAARYFDDKAQYFATGTDIINKDLIVRLTKRTDKGAVVGRVYTIKNGEREYTTSLQYLQDIPRESRPSYVLGQDDLLKNGTPVYVVDEKDAITKAWEPLSESLARVSREPIWDANFLAEWRRLQPQIDRLVRNGLDEETAINIIGNTALRRAEDISLSYMDNPRTRTMLAYNVRNISRYYRATEDFYRRVLRLTKYNPEGIQKIALSYNVVDHSGYVYTDENGEQYFMYPGTKPLMDAIFSGLNIFNNLTGGTSSIANPFGFYGKTLMLTPSADPDSWRPTFAGPIAAVPLKMMTSWGPLAPFEELFFGPKGTQATTGLEQASKEVLYSIFPGHVIRILNAMPFDRDERESQWASLTRSTLQIMAYNGRLDSVATEADMENARNEASLIASSVLVIRAAFGFILPASPQAITEQGLSDEARELGVKNLRPAFLQLVNQYKGDLDKATLTWFKLNPKLAVFTLGQSESGVQTYPSVTEEAGKWIQNNKETLKKYPQAGVFLMPRAGDFSFDVYNLAKSFGFIRGKEVDKYMLEALTVRDYYKYQATKDDYEKALANAPTTQQREALRQWWKDYTTKKYMQNPFLQQRVLTMSDKSNLGLKNRVLDEFRIMFREIDKTDKNLFTKSGSKIERMLATFDDGMIELNGIKGTTNIADSYKAAVRARLRQILKDIAKKDQNAMDFYENLLSPMIGGDEE